MPNDIYNFETDRLTCKEWHALTDGYALSDSLESIVKDLLSPKVTESLPPPWQGDYSIERARNWIAERDAEGVTLLVLEKSTCRPLGLIVLFEMEAAQGMVELRLGYLLAESAWGRGFGSELVQGLVDNCRKLRVASLVGGVAADNLASIRVLEKSGFERLPATNNGDEYLYRLQLRPI